jgi:hypothetical protein
MNYKNGKIYKIVCNITGKIYIGSTCMPKLSQRLVKHGGNFREYLKGKGHFISSFEILENENFDIILLESYPCECKEELHARERWYIENTICVNKVIPIRTLQEYIQFQKEYRQNNKDKLKEYYKNLYHENIDSRLENMRNYRESNREKIRKWQNMKRDCPCGGKYTNANKILHEKTTRHKNFLLTLQPN